MLTRNKYFRQPAILLKALSCLTILALLQCSPGKEGFSDEDLIGKWKIYRYDIVRQNGQVRTIDNYGFYTFGLNAKGKIEADAFPLPASEFDWTKMPDNVIEVVDLDKANGTAFTTRYQITDTNNSDSLVLEFETGTVTYKQYMAKITQ